MTIYLSVIVAVVGVLVYALSNGKPAQIGLVAFAVGLLVFLALVGMHKVTLP